ncbi:MAG: hypothetical protein WD556_07185 [Actinomycetota bacterium]
MRAWKLILTTSLVTVWLIPSSLPASATGGACPPIQSRFSLWDVETEPYQADNAADANGNGSVCSRPTKQTFIEDGETYTVYLFIDDNVPA